ncbi:hypothetical protein PO124_18605 [Bacillus licheniformis]|nr:hypothetical protein [Bacillus licheniformis]
MQLIRNESELEKHMKATKTSRRFSETGLCTSRNISNRQDISRFRFNRQIRNAVYLWERDCSIQRRQQKSSKKHLLRYSMKPCAQSSVKRP